MFLTLQIISFQKFNVPPFEYYNFTGLYRYLYLCVCACVCMYLNASERVSVCVLVCLCMHVFLRVSVYVCIIKETLMSYLGFCQSPYPLF